MGQDLIVGKGHYEKRILAPPMPYAKVDLFIDVKTKKVLDFSLICRRQHDVKIAEKIFKRFRLKGITILGGMEVMTARKNSFCSC